MNTGVWTLPSSPFRFTLPVTRIPLRGEGSLRVLHGQTTQAIEGAAPGSLIETCCVTPTARLVALAAVAVLSDGAELLITAGSSAQVHQSLDRVLFPADRVELGQPEELLWHGIVNAENDAGGAGWSLPGQHWLLPPGSELPAALQAAVELSAEQIEQVRIHQGIPAPGAELSDDFNPFELGLRHRVSLEKGCYLGQETLAKLHSRDGLKQQLRRFLVPEGAAPPEPAQQLRMDTGERAAVVTSVSGNRGLLLLHRRAWDQSEIAGLQLSLPAAAEFESH